MLHGLKFLQIQQLTFEQSEEVFHDDGSIAFDGVRLTELTPEKAAGYRIARTFQNIRLFQGMMAVENVMIGMHQDLASNLADVLFHTKRTRREERSTYEKALRWMEYVGLADKRHELAKNLSYGGQRYLEIARALALNPKLLLLDEPAAGLNPRESEALTRFIKELRDKLGLTILFIEHDMKVVMDISDKIAVLNYGKKTAEGLPAEIRQNKAVIDAYLGEEEEGEHTHKERREACAEHDS